ncbi:hypothetical protein, partial [Caballeronia sordidicola]|uniref:hypothetical protein n=1 Tax=Caballeronia sordidicola TaxID=196367 RepID=UPI001C5318ED
RQPGYGIASRRSCGRTSPISCTRLSRARLNLPRGAQVNRIGIASRQNHLKISPSRASAFPLDWTTLRQLCDNPLIDNDFYRLRAPEFAD